MAAKKPRRHSRRKRALLRRCSRSPPPVRFRLLLHLASVSCTPGKGKGCLYH